MDKFQFISIAVFVFQILQCTNSKSVNLVSTDLSNYNEESAKDLISERLSGLLIGTKWCGPGNVAENINDLGYNRVEDACCRAHDNCEYSIEPNVYKYRLYNHREFTMVWCKCEAELYQCLKNANTPVAHGIARIYKFTDPTCFEVMKMPFFCQAFPNACRGYRSDEEEYIFPATSDFSMDEKLENLNVTEIEEIEKRKTDWLKKTSKPTIGEERALEQSHNCLDLDEGLRGHL